MPEEDTTARATSKSFLEHLEDLRKTLMLSLVALVAGMGAVCPFAGNILDLLKHPLVLAGQDPGILLRSMDIGGGFAVTMRIVFWSGLLVATPFITFFVGRFVFPGLTPGERATVKRSLWAVVTLFVLGVCVGYLTTLPTALRVMFGVADWVGAPLGPITIGSYVTFCLQLLLGFGLAFELPAVLVVLGNLGIVTSRQLREKRRYAIVLILILAAILTPPDLASQLLMAVPLLILYEVSVLILRGKEGRKSLPDRMF